MVDQVGTAAPQWNQMEGGNVGKYQNKTPAEGRSRRGGRCGNAANLPHVGEEAERFGCFFPKESFLILNSADMFSLWELKTFI